MPPVTSMRQSGSNGVRFNTRWTTASASMPGGTRRSMVAVASAGTTLGALPPLAMPTTTETPLAKSVIASRSRICRASSRSALRPSCGREPAWLARPVMVTSKRPQPLRAVTHLPPSRAGSITSTYFDFLAAASMAARLVGLPTSSSGT
jgi:hypothetical protein